MNRYLSLELPLRREMMTTVRLATGGVCAAAGLSYDGGEDCKVCVTESLLLLMRRGFSAASVQFYEDARGIDVRVRGTEGGGDAALSDEDEIALALLNALAESVCVRDADGSITFLFGSQA